MSHGNLVRGPTDHEGEDHHHHQLHHLPLGPGLGGDTIHPLSWAPVPVQLGHDHGVADDHEQDGDEEHDDVDQGVVDLLGCLQLYDPVSGRITLRGLGEDISAGLGGPVLAIYCLLYSGYMQLLSEEDHPTHLDYHHLPVHQEGGGHQGGHHPHRHYEVPAEGDEGDEHHPCNVPHLAFLCVTLVLSGSITARNLSKEMAERVRMLETIHNTGQENNMKLKTLEK